MEGEFWTNIKDYPNYAISTYGNVENMNTCKILKYGMDVKKGYYFVNLCRNGKYESRNVHRLVADAFIPNPENKETVDHRDGNRLNNNISNLRWATRSEQARNTKIQSNNVSGVRGVSFINSRNKWSARICIDGNQYFLGYFKTLDEAKEARINKANEIFGEFKNICENYVL